MSATALDKVLSCAQRGAGMAPESGQRDLPMALALAALREATRLTQLDLRMQARVEMSACMHGYGAFTAQFSVHAWPSTSELAQRRLAGLELPRPEVAAVCRLHTSSI